MKNIDEIHKFVDKQNKVGKKSYKYLITGMLLGLSIFGIIIMGFFFVKPLVYDGKKQLQSNIPNIPSISQEQNNTPAYFYWYAPPSSFGVSSMKLVNWSYFKQLFNSHTSWSLEYKRYNWSSWTDGNQYLTINKTWNESGGFWKFNLIFDVPVDVYSARFTFGCDLPVLKYIEREGYEVWLNYSANATEVYSVMFNWSDIASIPGLIITKGTMDDMFWFRFRRDNIPAGHYEFDPQFGYTSATTQQSRNVEDVIKGTVFLNNQGSGDIDNVTAYMKCTVATHNVSALVFNNDTGSFVARSIKKDVAANNYHWEVFNFATGTVANNTNYLLTLWSDAQDGLCYLTATADANYDVIYDIHVYNGHPDPFGYDGVDKADYKGNIYCSFTVGVVESWQEIESDKNGSGYNLTVLQPISWDLNGSGFNTTIFQPISWDLNGSGYNTTGFSPISWNINGSGYNLTVLQPISWDLNGSGFNTTIFQPISWDLNGSGWNISWYEIDSSINGSGFNISVPLAITITGIYPSNNSFNIPLQPYVYATFSHQTGNVMNISWYNDTTLLGSENNITNGTYNELFYTANIRAGVYTLNITVNDGEGNWANETIRFTTESDITILSGGINPAIGIIGVIGLFGFIFYIMKRKRRYR